MFAFQYSLLLPSAIESIIILQPEERTFFVSKHDTGSLISHFTTTCGTPLCHSPMRGTELGLPPVNASEARAVGEIANGLAVDEVAMGPVPLLTL